MLRVAINGFGRIGRAAGKILLEREEIQLVAINDLSSVENLAYLLKYDTVYGRYDRRIEHRASSIAIDDHEIQVLNEKDPENLPWRDLAIDVVIESTGSFETREGASKHLTAGAKAVIISAPSKGENPAPTYLRAINDTHLTNDRVINNGSCTTNCIAPVIQILHDAFGVEKALMTTVHGYTATQSLTDSPGGKDLRRGRAAAANIVPTSTGAAVATTEAIPELKGIFDGLALRVPVTNGSISDITALLGRDVSEDELNQVFESAAQSDRYRGILDVTRDPIVSSDIIGNPHSAVVDLSLTQAIGNLVKVFAWYDNEYAYSMRLVEMVEQVGGSLAR